MFVNSQVEDEESQQTYVGPVEFKMTADGRGRGLFAKQDIKQGSVILFEEAFASSHFSKASEEHIESLRRILDIPSGH